MKLYPYQLPIPTVLARFRTDPERGLSEREVTLRLQRVGFNELPEPPVASLLHIFLSQFQNPLIYILLLAAGLIFFFGNNYLDAAIISGVLFFNAIIGTIQERRTYSILRALRHFIVNSSIVIRNGTKVTIFSRELVTGDIVLLQEGERVPADIRLVISNSIQVDEAILTGESSSVKKSTDTIEQVVPLADRKNMLFQGTYILSGSGIGVVVATGIETEIGKIHQDIYEFQADMPLKRELDRLSYWILAFVLSICLVLFCIGFIIEKPIQELLVMLTALFICVIPEGLPVVLTLVLVTGVYKMAQHHVLIKHMQAVEGLGRAHVIVVDKTGTLTRNEMMVNHVYADNTYFHVTGQGYQQAGELLVQDQSVTIADQYPAVQEMAYANILLNSTQVTYQADRGQFEVKGDPTEAALAIFAEKVITDSHLLPNYTKVYEMPFHTDYKYHAGWYQTDHESIFYMVGSPEVVMTRSEPVDTEYQHALDSFLEQGLRVIAVAVKKVPRENLQEPHMQKYMEDMLQNMRLLGFCGLQDAIRPEVSAAVLQARAAGLRIIMATGDHMQTALYVAKKVGIFQTADRVMTGAELDNLSDEALLKMWREITVFARVAPEHKLRIILMCHQLQEAVAMTGDGINDASSLAAADVGIAMGTIGTEVAKQAADIILLDDSFAHIVTAIEHGRHIFYTLKRVILYFFATNTGEILIVLFALCFNMPLPITAAQILWLNLVTDGFLDVALAMEPQEEGLLLQRWWLQKGHRRLIDWQLAGKMIFMAIPMGVGSILIFYYYYKVDIAYARTVTLLAMAMFQWFNAWNCRSNTKSLFQIGIFKNRWLVITTLFVLCLQVLLVYNPFLQHIFKTVAIAYKDWLLVIVVSFSIIIIEELRKWIVRHWFSTDAV